MAETIVPIRDIEVGSRFRRDMGDLDGLAASIERVGLLHAIVVRGNPAGSRKPWLLVAGARRLRACERLGWERVPVRVIVTEDLLAAEHDENVVRLDFSPSEAVAIAEALRPAAKAAARERMAEAAKGGQIAHPSRADDHVAAAVGMSRRSLDAATEVVRAAEADPVLAPLVEHMDETGKVEPAHKALRSLPDQPSPEEVKKALASRDAAYDRNYPGWREVEAAEAARLAWLDTWSAIHKAMAKSPPSVVALLERDDLDDIPRLLQDAREWLDAAEAAWQAAQKPRLVKGDVS